MHGSGGKYCFDWKSRPHIEGNPKVPLTSNALTFLVWFLWLQVFKLDLANLVFTLHGHYGPISSIFIDHFQCGTGGSGSQDGLLCVWDLITGACMYSIQAHDGAIVSLVCASSYVISLGADERLYIWERFQGNLLNTINVPYVYTSIMMLTPSLLVASKPGTYQKIYPILWFQPISHASSFLTGSLLIWDVRTGEQTREIKLDCANLHLCPKKILFASGSVICDYGNEMRIVRFPLVTDKCDWVWPNSKNKNDSPLKQMKWPNASQNSTFTCPPIFMDMCEVAANRPNQTSLELTRA